MFYVQGIQMNGKLNHRHSSNEVKTQAIFSYRPGKQVNLDLNLKRQKGAALNINADITLSYPGREMHFSESLQETAANKYHNELSVQWQKNSELTSTADLTIANQIYDAQVNIDVPSFKPVMLTFTGKPTIDDFTVKAKVEYGSQAYATSLSYNYDHIEQAQGSIDMQCPYFHIQSDGVISAKGSDYNTNLNVKWGSGQKMSLDGSFKLANGIDGHVKLVYPGRKVKMTMKHGKNGQDYTSQGELSWDTDKIISLGGTYGLKKLQYGMILNGNVNVRTPFTNFEKLQTIANVKLTRRQVLSKTSFSWAVDKIVSANLDMRMNGYHNTESSLVIDTPFTEQWTSKVSYNLNGNQLSSHLESSLGARKVEMDINGKMESTTNIEGSVVVKTPFQGASSMETTIIYNVNRPHQTGNLEVRLENKKIQFGYSGSRQMNGDTLTTERQFNLKTPFEHMQDASLTMHHSHNNQKYSSSVDMQWEPTKRIIVNINKMFAESTYTAKVTLDTPFQKLTHLGYSKEMEITGDLIRSYDIVSWNDKQIVLDVDTNRRNGVLSASISLQTPFPIVRSASANAALVDNKITLSANRNGREEISFNGNMNLNGINMEGQVEMKIPALHAETMSVKASANLNNMPYTTYTEISWAANQKITFNSEVTVQGIELIRAKTHLITPFTGVKQIVMNVDHAQNAGTWKSTADLEYAPNHKVEVSSEVAPGPQVSVNIKSPCQYMKQVSINVNHDIKRRGINNVATISYEADFGKFSVNSNARTNINMLQYNIKVSTPYANYEKMSFGVAMHKKGGEWVSNVGVEYQSTKKIEAELRIAQKPKGSILIKTPFRAARMIAASFEHEGDLITFENKITFDMTSYGKKTDFDSKLAVQGISAINGQARIQGANDMILNVNHNMGSNSLSSNADLTFEGKKGEVSVMLTADNKLSGRIIVATPFNKIQTMSISFNHEGELPTINSQVELRCTSTAGLSSMDAVISLNGISSMNGQVELVTPFMQKTVSRVSLTKEKNEWVVSGSGGYGSQKVSAEAHVNIPETSGSFNFESPFLGYEHISGSTSYGTEYGNKMFINVVKFDLQYAAEKRVTADIRGTVMPYLDIKTAVTTPYQYLKDIKFNIGHFGNLNEFRAYADLDHNMLGSKIISEVNFKLDNMNLEASAELKAPFTGFENLRVSVDHKSKGVGRFISSATIEYGDNQSVGIQSQLNLESLSKMDGQVSYTGPSHRVVTLNFNHNGNFRKFNCHAEVNINNFEKSAFDATFDSGNAIRGDIKMTSPFMNDIEFLVYHQGQMSAFQNQVDMKALGEEIHFTSSFKTSPTIEVQIHLTSPFTENIDFSMTHQGNVMNFQHVSELQYAPNMKIHISGNLAVDTPIKGKFQIRTPFNSLQNAEIVFTQSGNHLAFDNDIRVVYGEYDMSYLGHFTMNNNSVEGRFVVKVPNIESAIVEFNHAATANEYTTYTTLQYGGQKIEAEGSLEISPRINGHFSMKTPFEVLKYVSAVVGHDRKYNMFEGNAEATYNGQNMFKVSANFAMTPVIKGSFALNTPFQVIKDMSASFNHDGSLMGFASDAKLSYNGQLLVQADGSFKMSPSVEGTLNLKQNIMAGMETTSLTFYHDGGRTRFNCNGAVSVDNKELISYTGSLITNNGQFVLNSVYPTVKKLSVTFTKEGTMQSLSGVAKLSLNDISLAELDGDYQLLHGVTVNANLKTASSLMQDGSVSISHMGNIESFTNQATLSIHGKSVKYKLSMTMNPLEMSAELQTPFTHIEHVKLTINHQGSLSQFHSHAFFSSDDISSIQMDANFNYGSEISGTFSVETPLMLARQTSLSFRHSGDLSAFTSQVQMSNTHFGSAKMEADISTVHGISSTFKINTPFSFLSDASAHFSFDTNIDGIQSRAKVILC